MSRGGAADGGERGPAGPSTVLARARAVLIDAAPGQGASARGGIAVQRRPGTPSTSARAVGRPVRANVGAGRLPARAPPARRANGARCWPTSRGVASVVAGNPDAPWLWADAAGMPSPDDLRAPVRFRHYRGRPRTVSAAMSYAGTCTVASARPCRGATPRVSNPETTCRHFRVHRRSCCAHAAGLLWPRRAGRQRRRARRRTRLTGPHTAGRVHRQIRGWPHDRRPPPAPRAPPAAADTHHGAGPACASTAGTCRCAIPRAASSATAPARPPSANCSTRRAARTAPARATPSGARRPVSWARMRSTWSWSAAIPMPRMSCTWRWRNTRARWSRWCAASSPSPNGPACATSCWAGASRTMPPGSWPSAVPRAC